MSWGAWSFGKLVPSFLPLVLTPSTDAALTCVSMTDDATSLGMTSSATANLQDTRELPVTNVSQMA